MTILKPRTKRERDCFSFTIHQTSWVIRMTQVGLEPTNMTPLWVQHSIRLSGPCVPDGYDFLRSAPILLRTETFFKQCCAPRYSVSKILPELSVRFLYPAKATHQSYPLLPHPSFRRLIRGLSKLSQALRRQFYVYTQDNVNSDRI